jgi:hypothetical protein
VTGSSVDKNHGYAPTDQFLNLRVRSVLDRAQEYAPDTLLFEVVKMPPLASSVCSGVAQREQRIASIGRFLGASGNVGEERVRHI